MSSKHTHDAVAADEKARPKLVRLPPVGFWSYSRQDDELSFGKLSNLRKLLMAEIQQQYGKERVQLFQDATTISHGAEWEHEIRTSLSQASFFIPIITPNFIQSEWCCREVMMFVQREQELFQTYPELARRGRMFPFLLIDITGVESHDEEVLAILHSRQMFDYRALRFRNLQEEEVHQAIASFASSIREVLNIKVEDPASRAAAEAAHAAELERKRREAAAAAEEARRRDEAAALAAAKQAEAERKRAEEKAAVEAKRRQEEEEAKRATAAARIRQDEEDRRRREIDEAARRAAELETQRQKEREEAERRVSDRKARRAMERVAEQERLLAEERRARDQAELDAHRDDLAAEAQPLKSSGGPAPIDVSGADPSLPRSSGDTAKWIAGAAAALLILFVILLIVLPGSDDDKIVADIKLQPGDEARTDAATSSPAPAAAAQPTADWLVGRWGPIGSGGAIDCSQAIRMTSEGGRLELHSAGDVQPERVQRVEADRVTTDTATYAKEGTMLRRRNSNYDLEAVFGRCG